LFGVEVLRRIYWILLGLMIAVGSWWLISNTSHIPEYGDTAEYLALSKTLAVDQYRTIFYPLFLRLSGIFRDGNSEPLVFWAYFIQVLATLASSAVYASALLKMFSSRPLSTRTGVAVVVLSTAITATNPLVTHFALSIMSDSLASSLTVATVGAFAHLVCSAGDSASNRRLWLASSVFCLSLMALSRVDKLYLGSLLALVVIICLYRSGPQAARPRISGIALSLMVAVVAPIWVNHATQTHNPDRPPLDLSSMAFNRVVWPRLTRVYPYLPADAKSLISDGDAVTFDANNVNVYPLLDRILKGHPENKRVVDEVTKVTLHKFPLQVAGKTAFDIVKYMMPNLAFPLELASVLPESAATAWTYSRMSQVHPVMTRIWLLISTAIFLFFQLPVAVVFLRKCGGRELMAQSIVLLTAVGIAGNALLFGLEAGMDAHIRYALPSFVMMLEMVTVASLLWLFDGFTASIKKSSLASRC
jgi:hypothetical protein